MAAVETVETVTPASPPSQLTQPSYLKTYPYLFVRETDQTDYFCTVCEHSLKEDQLQSHLFEGHSAENLQDYFVRVSPGVAASGQKKWLYICVVCWAKMGQVQEMHGHRETCKVSFGDDGAGEQGENEGVEPTSVVSTPDIPTMIEEQEESNMNGSRMTNGREGSPPPFPHPEVILDTETPHVIQLPKYPETAEVCNKQLAAGNLVMKQEPVYSSQCMQCSLCTMILPSSSYLSHLRAYHRVSCPLTNANCPLCMSLVPIMDLTVHLASQHGLVPQSAVNALLLWVLTSNTFALNDSAQASLKAKFKGHQAGQLPVSAAVSSTSTTKSKPTPISTPNLPQAPLLSKPRSALFPASSSIPPSSSMANKNGLPQINKGGLEGQEPSMLNDLRGKVAVEQIVAKFTRSHMGPGGKQSHQCLVCSKWYAVPPVKHLRSHMMTFNKERRKLIQLASGAHICLICYRVFDTQAAVTSHVATHCQEGSPPGLPGGGQGVLSTGLGGTGGLLAEALLGFQPYSSGVTKPEQQQVNGKETTTGTRGGQQEGQQEMDDLPLGATFETPGLKPNSPSPSLNSSHNEVNIELDNAGRVKSGKVRKQCELCGEWSNIKWFFKHMSEVHQALFCRCCREYLPIHEHKEHRTWHGMPPYMGQKIRIEDGQPIIIDRKERASLTPIGSLAAWGGSSGGLVVKAVDEISRKRKAAADRLDSPNGSVKTSNSSGDSVYQVGMLPPDLPALPELDDDPGRDSLMPKERCPVCSIEITHKNLARHIKLRHGIKYKFCYKCRKLVPGQLYAEHKALHESGQLESLPAPAPGDKHLEFGESCKTDEEEDETIEIPEEMLDEALDGNNPNRKDDSFRANTSMTKLESLMGKEFKHPRRKCQICGYSVSYSNFKRHLRNAHPGEVVNGEDGELVPSMMREDGGELMGHHMDDGDRLTDNTFDDVEKTSGELVEGYVECRRCGDYVMKEFLARHMRLTHGEEIGGEAKAASPRPRNIIMRPCPVCGVEMRSDSITKHCKTRHKISYRYCSACSKYILKKYFKSHLRKHESGELPGEAKKEGELEEDLDTSKDGDDEEEKDENEEDADEDATEPMETDSMPLPTKLPSKIYNCVDCTRMFMSADAHANHLREMHGGEGGSIVLKLPGDRLEDKEDSDDKMGDELVIDDSK